MEQPGNFALKELDPLDLRAAQNIILKHRMQLEEMGHRVQRSKEALKALEDFLASLRAAELSGEPFTDLSAPDSQVVPENTSTVERKEGEIHWMKDKARHLDISLKMLGISIRDTERGENTSCEKLLDTLSKNSSETRGSGGQKELTEEEKLLETCIFKNNELLKNIQDVHSQISKIGLKDPTVPAVKQRWVSFLSISMQDDIFLFFFNPQGCIRENKCFLYLSTSVPSHFIQGSAFFFVNFSNKLPFLLILCLYKVLYNFFFKVFILVTEKE